MNILDTIAEATRERVTEKEKLLPLFELKQQCELLPKGAHRFKSALTAPGLSFICEIKKASPSKGLIDPVFDYPSIAKEYAAAGASAISCLTEPRWFMGSDEIFETVRSLVPTPMLRKDFTVSEYQLYEAKLMGADAVLLIVAITEKSVLRDYLTLCAELGLDALVETHDAAEIDIALQAGASILGVNNRNLKDFTVDFSNASMLRSRIPEECVYVAESGVSSPDDVAQLKTVGADAVLIGEMLMRSSDKKTLLNQLRGI